MSYKLSTSAQLKLSKSAREGGSDVFSFFETTRSLGNDFKAVYDLHTSIEALSKSLVLYNMIDVFQVLPISTLQDLEPKLRAVHACQVEDSRVEAALTRDLTDMTMLAEIASSKIAIHPVLRLSKLLRSR